ncbi:type II toxin-antitoxin system RelE/ParE family toxin [Sphingomonas bacterium]|uniref:type II toxin-antitoxin system RelE/ParE family toxin n=1 Tax=Sphingomonas bacterium TaxID=1895847 RepID=UPI001575744B|nr:type II toxin-antitoxin system RelE/ParE family toxin [Sphingomonas bacterium]
MADVVWRRSAIDDLNRIIAYIRKFDPAAADDYRKRLTALGESLSSFPHRGRATSGRRREMVTIAPYILGYRVTGHRVSIESIRHSARQPLD